MIITKEVWWKSVLLFLSFWLFTAQLRAQAPVSKADTDRVNSLISAAKTYSCKDSALKVRDAIQAVQIAEQVQWKKGMIKGNIALGRIYAECMGRYAVCNRYVQQAILIARSCKDTDNEALGLVLMAQAYGKLNQYNQKIYCYREVLSLRITPERRTGAFSNMGGAYDVLGDHTAALVCYDSALQVLDRMMSSGRKNSNNDTVSKALIKMSVGDVYHAMGEDEYASGNYKSALALFEKANSTYGIIIALTGIGKAYHSMNKDEKAIACYFNALEKCNNATAGNDYKNERLIVYNLLGKLYLQQDETAKAFDYGLRSMGLIEECPDNKEVAVTYNLMGEIYTRLKNYDNAILYLDKAIKFSRKAGALDYERDALQTLSETYVEMRQPGKALDAYKQFIAIRDSVYSLDKVKEVTRHEMTADFTEKRAALLAEQDKRNAVQQAVMDLTLKRQRLAYGAFTVIIILLLLVGILLRNRFKLREKLEMQLAIAGERTRISAEMHDDMGSELSKISLLSEIVKGDAEGQNMQSHLDNISRSSKELLDKMGEIVWSLNDKYDTLESLMIYIRRYAMEYFSATQIDCRINMPEHFPAVAMEGALRRNIFLVVKEALHNVLKHSKGDLVTMTIVATAQSLSINIQDNGVGIDRNAISVFGNGMSNMKKRIADVGGKFEEKNENGTSIDLVFPFFG